MLKSKLHSLVILTLLSVINLPSFSQQNNFKTYSIENGLSQSTIFSIFQDSRGYLWIGTDGGGVNLFDGKNFKHFNKKTGLAGNTVRSTIEDSKGNLWIGTDEGITVYDGLKFKIIDQVSGFNFLSLFEDSQFNIWAGTAGDGLKMIKVINKDSVLVETITAEDGLSSNHIFDIYEDKAKRLWLATYGGGINILTFSNIPEALNHPSDTLTKPAGETEKTENIKIIYLTQYAIPSNIILSIEEDIDGNLWFGTSGEGAFKIITTNSPDSGKVIVYNSTNGLNDNTIWDILSDHTGNIWFGTNEGGINKLDHDISRGTSGKISDIDSLRQSGESFTAFTEQHGLPGNQILTVFEDNEGNIWFGTIGNGLCKFIGYNFSHYTEKEGLSNNNIYNIKQDINGDFWLASYGGGITRLYFSTSGKDDDSPVFTNYGIKDGLISNTINSLSISSYSELVEAEQILWIATAEGLSKLLLPIPTQSGLFQGKKSKGVDKLNFTNYSEDDGLADNNIYCVFADSRGIVWCGTAGGLSVYNGEKFRNITSDQGLPHNEVQTIIEDRNSNMWFGTWDGLAQYNFENLTTYDEVEGLYDKKVFSLTEGPQGNIWIGTFGGGLYKLNTSTDDTIPIKLVADDSLLSSNNIYSLIFPSNTELTGTDGQNGDILIVGTDKGFDKLMLDSSQNIINIRHYGKVDGFAGVENNLNAIYEDDKENIWFGTVHELTKYDPDKDKINKVPPRTHITDVKLNFEKVDWTEYVDSVDRKTGLPVNLSLNYYQNHLTFNFTGICLTIPEKVRYQFILDGLDPDWSPVNDKTEATYSGIPPGHYTFKVKASNNDDLWNENPTTFSFVITPPFWQTWWFYMICTLLAIIGIVAFIKIRERKLKMEKKILEEKVEERTVQLREKSEELAEALTDITDSINYASRIQEAILPQDEEIEQLLPQSFVLFKPKDIVSGDFYWLSNKDDKLFLVAADCTGHGVPGAFMSMISTTLLNEVVNDKAITKPSEIFFEVRKNIITSLKQTGVAGQQKDGMDAVLCVFNKNNNIMECVCANNPLLIIRNEGTNPLITHSEIVTEEGEKKQEKEPDLIENSSLLFEIKADRQPVGYFSGEQVPFTNHLIQLQKGDVVYIFSDGFQDQFGGPKGKKFMIKRMKQMLLEIQVKNMKEQKEYLDKTIEDWKAHNDPSIGKAYEQIDDILLIGIKV
ncbi:MAG: two-component regulator propeller domain-containing protein [Bacteroidota bacterium]